MFTFAALVGDDGCKATGNKLWKTMTVPMNHRKTYALEDCELLLATERQATRSTSNVSLDIELFEALLDIARQAKRWGA